LIVLSAGVAHAGERKVQLGLNFADAVISDSDRPDAFAMYWSLDYDFAKHFSIGAELGYLDQTHFDAGVKGDSLETEARVGLFHIGPSLKFFTDLEAGSMSWRPYAITSVGMYHSFTRTRSLGLSGTKAQHSLDTDVGFGVGGGARLFLSEGFGLGAEARFLTVTDKGKDPLQAVLLSAGLIWRL